MPKIDIPQKLLCPITHELFKTPVIAEDGHTYEQAAIAKWVTKNGTSPFTREKIAAKFIPAREKKQQIMKFFNKAHLCTEEQFFSVVREGNVEHLSQLNYLDSYLKAKDNTTYGRTPLHWAASNGHDSVVELLLENEADIEAKNNKGATSLHLAAYNGQNSVVKLLLENKANIEAKDTTYGNTPLHWAAFNGKDSTVKLLLEKGASHKVVNNAGKTPVQEAISSGKNKIVVLIPAYHQQLKNEAKQAPAEVKALKQTVQQQAQRIQQLEQQLQQVLTHLKLNPTASSSSPAFFKS